MGYVDPRENPTMTSSLTQGRILPKRVLRCLPSSRPQSRGGQIVAGDLAPRLGRLARDLIVFRRLGALKSGQDVFLAHAKPALLIHAVQHIDGQVTNSSRGRASSQSLIPTTVSLKWDDLLLRSLL